MAPEARSTSVTASPRAGAGRKPLADLDVVTRAAIESARAVGRLCAVIDFGCVGLGDPAADVIAAWSVFGQTGRGMFRGALDVDDGTWDRARGFALHQAAMIISYYGETNPGFVALAKRTFEEVLVDIDA